MPNDAQLLKAYGHLPTVELPDIQTADVDPAQYDPVLHDRTCAHPDFPDEELAGEDEGRIAKYLDVDEEHAASVKEMHKRWLSKTGNGSWPVGCHSQYPQRHSFTYLVNVDSFPSQYKRQVEDSELDYLVKAKVWGDREKVHDLYSGKSVLEASLLLCEETYRRRGVAMIRVESEGEDDVHIRAKPIPGSTIGYAYFNDATCSDHVTCNIDSTYSPGLHACATLIAHELGHNNNLQHTFSGQSRHHGVMSYSPMYPFVGYSTGEDPYDRPLDPSVPVLIRYYGDEPIPVEEPPTPTPPEQWPVFDGPIYGEVLADGRVAIRGVPVLKNINGRDWPYIVTPVTGQPGKYRIGPKYT